jgi:hypothetical protein
VVSGLCVARACLFIFASELCAHYTRWMLSLSLSFSFLFYRQTSRLQAAAGEEEEAKDAEEAKETGEDEEERTQEEKYGRNCRQSSSSADCSVSVRHKIGRTA